MLPSYPHLACFSKDANRLYDSDLKGLPIADDRQPLQRDRDRIIHCDAFRRLQQKTQVFVSGKGDYRTRLTHSLEVSQIARSLSRFFGLNEDLSEAVALAHDLGHPPFGHAGEDALHQALGPDSPIRFDHNLQTFRILTKLEVGYHGFNGLNLTFETLEAITLHNGPIKPERINDFVYGDQPLRLDGQACLEGQAAALADDVAYTAHDLDDALRENLFTLDYVCDQVPLVGDIVRSIKSQYDELDSERLRRQLTRTLIHNMLVDIYEQTKKNLADINPQSIDDIRALDRPMIAFSAAMKPHIKGQEKGQLGYFFKHHLYQHCDVASGSKKAEKIIRFLVTYYRKNPLPSKWRKRYLEKENNDRMLADYIASWTDYSAKTAYQDLKDKINER